MNIELHIQDGYHLYAVAIAARCRVTNKPAALAILASAQSVKQVKDLQSEVIAREFPESRWADIVISVCEHP